VAEEVDTAHVAVMGDLTGQVVDGMSEAELRSGDFKVEAENVEFIKVH
jgi:hypothetical protein